ncbi:DUF4184 family protein [Nocardiopsis trehalosi]|uniref:DUF4184 family protein n=1 Tax=Nocardiopsis trehalosi TaxID=109329 RepID=UPI00082D2B14|nr:DUF4184 family protein [Nocardiopsis trehalosi]
MPFTVSHVAAVLPLARSPLPTAALAVGAVVPDLPYYLPLPLSSHTTHGPPGLPIGVLAGAGMLAVLRWGVHAPVAALAPDRVRSRLTAEPPPLTARRALLVAAALVVGILTHLVWDAFTQVDGAAVRSWPLLWTMVAPPHRLFNVVMYASSVLGLAAVAGWAVLRLRSARPEPTAPPGLPPRVRAAVAAAVVVCAIAGAALLAATPRAAVSGYDLVRCLVLGGMQGGAGALACYVAAWHALRPWRARGPGGHRPGGGLPYPP